MRQVEGCDVRNAHPVGIIGTSHTTGAVRMRKDETIYVAGGPTTEPACTNRTLTARGFQHVLGGADDPRSAAWTQAADGESTLKGAQQSDCNDI